MEAVLVGFLGTTELILILAIVVLIFGVGKLPEVGKQLGLGIRQFKSELGAGEKEARQLESDSAASASDQSSAPRDVTEEHRSKSST